MNSSPSVGLDLAFASENNIHEALDNRTRNDDRVLGSLESIGLDIRGQMSERGLISNNGNLLKANTLNENINLPGSGTGGQSNLNYEEVKVEDLEIYSPYHYGTKGKSESVHSASASYGHHHDNRRKKSSG